MNDGQTLRGKLLSAITIAVGLLFLIPLALLFVLWFHVAALAHGAWLLLCALFRKTAAPPAPPLQKPHFSETRSGVPTKD